ncbi:hypothetical protein BJ742DRAFT_742445 [Cladochytrium replicatum]|nr:hypothetical protein BJ742DRAFT_742445 [Cladochytrium replicatum]
MGVSLKILLRRTIASLLIFCVSILAFTQISRISSAIRWGSDVKSTGSLLPYLLFQLQQIRYECQHQIRVGSHNGDVSSHPDGFAVCGDNLRLPKPTVSNTRKPQDLEPSAPYDECHVISIGVDHGVDFTFENDVRDRSGCEVHAFDPSFSVHDKEIGNKIHSHAYAIGTRFDEIRLDGGGTNATIPTWRVRPLSWVYEHFDIDRISLMKLDVSENAWNVLPSWTSNSGLAAVDQLLVEFNLRPTPEMIANNGVMSAKLEEWNDILTDLGKIGFKAFWSEILPKSEMVDFDVGFKVPCCFTVGYMKMPGLVESYIESVNQWVPSALSAAADKFGSVAGGTEEEEEDLGNPVDEDKGPGRAKFSVVEEIDSNPKQDDKKADGSDNAKVQTPSKTEDAGEKIKSNTKEPDNKQAINKNPTNDDNNGTVEGLTKGSQNVGKTSETIKSEEKDKDIEEAEKKRMQNVDNKAENGTIGVTDEIVEEESIGSPIMEDNSVPKTKVDLMGEALKATIPEAATLRKNEGKKKSESDVLTHGRIVDPARLQSNMGSTDSDDAKDSGTSNGQYEPQVMEKAVVGDVVDNKDGVDDIDEDDEDDEGNSEVVQEPKKLAVANP